MVVLRAGSYVNGATGSGVVVSCANGAMLLYYCSTRNGAADKITIEGDAGNTYGIYASDQSYATYANATYVTFVGAIATANTGADAATFSFVT